MERQDEAFALQGDRWTDGPMDRWSDGAMAVLFGEDTANGVRGKAVRYNNNNKGLLFVCNAFARGRAQHLINETDPPPPTQSNHPFLLSAYALRKPLMRFLRNGGAEWSQRS
jgi:hypothetical protein